MSAVLFREGDDLDQLLAELDAEHPDGVRVVDVRYDREGGVLGFFARRRVAVSYTPTDGVELDADDADAVTFEPAQPAAILFETAESEPEPVDDRAEFAKMLLEMAAEKAAQRSREDDPVIDPYDVFTPRGRHAAPDPDEGIVPPPPAVVTPPLAPSPVAYSLVGPSPVSAPPGSPAPAAPSVDPFAAPAAGEAPLARRRLLDLGIPVGWLPAHDADPVAAIRFAVARLRPARPPQGAQFVLVVAGPATLAVEAAREVHHRLGLRRAIHTVGIDGETQLRDERQAGWLAADVRLGDGGPAVVAVALDQQVGNGWDDDGTRRILDRLQPDTVWGVADARWRSADVRALFAELPRTDALAIAHADRTGSPAALWELDLPVALLDGRPATPAAWTALLLDRLDALG